MNDNSHNELLDNPNAEFQCKIEAFQDYVNLNYTSDVALKWQDFKKKPLT